MHAILAFASPLLIPHLIALQLIIATLEDESTQRQGVDLR